MRRFAACLLATVLICGLVPPAIAAGSGPVTYNYYRVDVEHYGTGRYEPVDFMIPSDNSGVYVNAGQLASFVGDQRDRLLPQRTYQE